MSSSNNNQEKKLWGGRFSGNGENCENTDEYANKFHSSLSFDKKLYKQDIKGSIAHAEMLGRQGIISSKDANLIIKTLVEIDEAIDSGDLSFEKSRAEDVHSFIEAELVKRIGDAGRRLHTGRSRNDQVALDMRMYVMGEIDETNALLKKLLKILLQTAKEHIKTIIPGYTHMQKAQPITLSHHVLAYFEMFRRDFERLADCRKRTDVMPLGSGALAAVPYPIDRFFVKEKLGFSEITANSLDAVSDRDFCIEFLSCLSMIMMHLSRFCEELILWSSDEFKFIEISDAYATGSSIMPQKKNPDMAELIRGKTGRVYGSLIALLTVMKGLPLAYNKDMQEDKEAVFDAADTVKSCLSVFANLFETITFNKDIMYNGAKGGYTNATDAADWLVGRGVPFRQAHEIIGRLVLYAIKQNKRIEELSLSELKSISDLFDEQIYEKISLETCINARSVHGGPADSAVLEAIKNAEEILQ